MQKKLIALCVAGACALPMAAHADVTVYGRIHMSVDAADNDTDANTNVSSNSSRLGVKGKTELKEGLTGLFQIESTVNVDKSGSNLATRNSYVGLQGNWGALLTGYHDTPFKDIRGKYFDIFGDTVGDARGILGAIDDENVGNMRAKNMLMYRTNRVGGLQFNAMYSTSVKDDQASGQDDNDTDLTSLSLTYEEGALKAGIAWEDYSAYDDSTPAVLVDFTGIRAGVRYALGDLTLGAIYEDIDDARSAYGLNAAYKVGSNTFKAQYLMADDMDGLDDSGANMLSIGVDHTLAKTTNVYAMYTMVDNDDNAAYVIGGGHGQKWKVAAGDEVSAFSVGIVHKF